MIFAASGAAAQLKRTIPPASSIHLSDKRQAGKGFQAAAPVTVTPVNLAPVPGNFYAEGLGYFCKKEIKFEKITRIPFKFRLGSVQQCDWLEGKAGTGMYRY